MESSEFKRKLFEKCKDKGILSQLRYQLRQQLVDNLPPSQELSDERDENRLVKLLTNSVFAEHMKRCHYDYTLSVFLPECHMQASEVLDAASIIHLLKIDPSCSLFKKLMKNAKQGEEHSFLHRLIQEVLTACGGTNTNAVAIQTDRDALTLDEKFAEIDRIFQRLKSESDLSVEEKLVQIQIEVEKRFHQDLHIQMEKFRQNEAGKIRMEERERLHREMSERMKQMEREYRDKLTNLAEREREFVQKVEKEHEHMEVELFGKRQNLLKDIALLNERESDLRRKVDAFQSKIELEENRMKMRDLEFEHREQELIRRETSLGLLVETEARRHRAQVDAEYEARMREIAVKDMRIAEKERFIAEEDEHLTTLRLEYREKDRLIKELEKENRVAAAACTKMEVEVGLLTTRVKEMTDYPKVRDENIRIKKEAETLQLRLKEAQMDVERERLLYDQLMREWKTKLREPQPEIEQLRRDLEELKEEHNLARTKSDSERERLLAQVDHQKQLNRELQNHSHEYFRQMQEMLREKANLADNYGVSKGMLMPPVGNGYFRTSTEPHPELVVEQRVRDIHPMVALNGHPPLTRTDGPCFHRPLHHDHDHDRHHCDDHSMEWIQEEEEEESFSFVSESMRRIHELESEAKSLEVKYLHLIRSGQGSQRSRPAVFSVDYTTKKDFSPARPPNGGSYLDGIRPAESQSTGMNMWSRGLYEMADSSFTGRDSRSHFENADTQLPMPSYTPSVSVPDLTRQPMAFDTSSQRDLHSTDHDNLPVNKGAETPDRDTPSASPTKAAATASTTTVYSSYQSPQKPKTEEPGVSATETKSPKVESPLKKEEPFRGASTMPITKSAAAALSSDSSSDSSSDTAVQDQKARTLPEPRRSPAVSPTKKKVTEIVYESSSSGSETAVSGGGGKDDDEFFGF